MPAALAFILDEPMEIDPAQALLWCVTLTAQEVHWLDSQIAEAARQGVSAYGRPITTVKKEVTVAVGGNMGSELVPTEVVTYAPEEVHILIRDRRDTLERLARFSKLAIDAGIAERMVNLAERIGEMVAPLLASVFEDPELALTAKQRKALPAVTGRHLRVLEGKVA